MKRSLFLLLLLSVLALAAVAARAEPNEPFTLTWDAVVSGGGVSSGGPYTLADTAGQPAAGASSGGPYTLVDGFQVSTDGFIPPPTPTPTPVASPTRTPTPAASPTRTPTPVSSRITLTAAASGPHSIRLTWTLVAGAQGYHIWRTFSGLPWQRITTQGASTTSYEDANSLACGLEAFYLAEPFNAGGSLPRSDYAFATTRGCWPNADPRAVAPTGLTSQFQNPNSIRLNWQDRTTNEERFKIMRTTLGNLWYQAGVVGANVTSFVDTEVGCGYQFYYMVRAERPSDRSVTEVIFTNATAPPCTGGPTLSNPRPLSLSQPTSSSLRLQWQNTYEGQTGYEMQRAIYGSGWQLFYIDGGSTTSYTDTGLACNTRYFYRVRSLRSGDGAFSEWSNFAQQSTAACAGASGPETTGGVSPDTALPPDLPPPESLAAPDILPDTSLGIDGTPDESAGQASPDLPGSERIYLPSILK